MKTTLLIILCLFSINTFAQRWQFQKAEKDTALINFKTAYLGTIRHPGFRMGVEIPITIKDYYKNDKLKKRKEQFLTSNFSFYHHETFHSNFILSFGYLFRRTNAHDWYIDFEPQIGLNKTLLDGTTYKVNEDGDVSKEKLAGYWYFNAQIGFSIGKDFKNTKINMPLKAYVKPNLIVMLPYNNFIYARPSIEIGAVYSFDNIFINNVKHKSYTK